MLAISCGGGRKSLNRLNRSVEDMAWSALSMLAGREQAEFGRWEAATALGWCAKGAL